MHIGQLKLAVAVKKKKKDLHSSVQTNYFKTNFTESAKDGSTCKKIVFSSISKESFEIFNKRGKETKFR